MLLWQLPLCVKWYKILECLQLVNNQLTVDMAWQLLCSLLIHVSSTPWRLQPHCLPTLKLSRYLATCPRFEASHLSFTWMLLLRNMQPREPIQTTGNEGKKFSALRADRLPPHTSTHCLPHWPYHSKMLPTGLHNSVKVIAPTWKADENYCLLHSKASHHRYHGATITGGDWYTPKV